MFAYAHLNTVNGSDIFGTQFHFLADLNQAREFKVGISVVNPDEPVTSQETYVEELQLQGHAFDGDLQWRSEEHTSELQSLMRISYAVFCLKKNKQDKTNTILKVTPHTHA